MVFICGANFSDPPQWLKGWGFVSQKKFYVLARRGRDEVAKEDLGMAGFGDVNGPAPVHIPKSEDLPPGS